MQCDGSSFEQSMLALDLTIRTHGWALVQVDDEMPWSYTVGLTESYDHPELMVAGLELTEQAGVIHRVAEPIERTGSVDRAELADAGIELAEVHPSHLAGDRFARWTLHYQQLPAPGTFLQVVPPSNWFCDCHRHAMPHFDQPGPIRSASRADRRRRRRGGRPRRT
jgi:hypothetical protein